MSRGRVSAVPDPELPFVSNVKPSTPPLRLPQTRPWAAAGTHSFLLGGGFPGRSPTLLGSSEAAFCGLCVTWSAPCGSCSREPSVSPAPAALLPGLTSQGPPASRDLVWAPDSTVRLRRAASFPRRASAAGRAPAPPAAAPGNISSPLGDCSGRAYWMLWPDSDVFPFP